LRREPRAFSQWILHVAEVHERHRCQTIRKKTTTRVRKRGGSAACDAPVLRDCRKASGPLREYQGKESAASRHRKCRNPIVMKFGGKRPPSGKAFRWRAIDVFGGLQAKRSTRFSPSHLPEALTAYAAKKIGTGLGKRDGRSSRASGRATRGQEKKKMELPPTRKKMALNEGTASF